MKFEATIQTRLSGNPVIIACSPEDEEPVMLQIGPTKPGQSRYVDLTRTQARTIARALVAAAAVTDEA